MRSVVLLLLLPAIMCDETTTMTQPQCAMPDKNSSNVSWDKSDICNTGNFENIQMPPPLRNLTDDQGNLKHDCGIVFILDLDYRYTSRQDFWAVKQFMSGVLNSCMMRGVGNLIFINRLFGDPDPPETCCDNIPCDPVINRLDYDYYVGNYSSTATVQPGDNNFTIAFLTDTKQLSGESSICLYNTVIFLSNRIFNSTEKLDDDVHEVEDYSCETMTIIGVGNPEITDELMVKYYTPLTDNQFIVPDYNCLPDLADCIKPCGSKGVKSCQEFQNVGGCNNITTTTPTTTTTTTSTLPPTASAKEQGAWHMIYLFALSNRTTNSDFNKAITYIQQPLQDCINEKEKIAVRFLARGNSDSGWLTDINSIHNHLVSLKSDEILLDASPTVDVQDEITLDLILSALHIPILGEKADTEPRLVLLTDFVSKNFISYYNVNDTLIKQMEQYDFEIYCFDENFLQDAANIYKNSTNIKSTHIHSDPNFSDSKNYEVAICPKKGTPVPIIMLIIVGTCLGVMVLLILITILYRQKYMWSEKLNKFKTSQSGRTGQTEEDVIDYWELSWDKLIVKNERLGHGAYGQVFKGKLIGPSPGIGKFYRSELPTYTDCDCAVKMLPRYASENARTEFMHEIQLMKTLGLHDNIVNMLGCITAATKSCLVLEFCLNRDLLRYLKHKKVELEISKSMDDQIELTKELLHLAWQIANGMRFLGEKNIIHRDLAARNILITGMEGLKNAKIGDFGLAMSATPGENALSASGRLPIKWLALESLQKEQFSFKSDVWSFGIVLFEMYSMGEIPFENVEPIELIPHLLQGNRPNPPLIAPEKIAEMMLSCWHKNPQERPTFQEMKDILMTLLEQATEGYGYLALLKTTENYRVISEINEAEPHNPMDDYYTDGPSVPITDRSEDIVSLSSGRLSVHSAIQVDLSVNRRPRRKSALTLRSIENDDEEYAEELENWVTRVRRRKSQLANLNPFRKIANLARSTSKGRTGSV